MRNENRATFYLTKKVTIKAVLCVFFFSFADVEFKTAIIISIEYKRSVKKNGSENSDGVHGQLRVAPCETKSHGVFFFRTDMQVLR